jgi:thymidine kinase
MIEFVYGSKGSGKTKKMIDMANSALETCEGDIIFLNDRDKYRVKVDTKIRFSNLEEFGIIGVDQLFGFLSGIIAENYDVKLIFIDNLLRLIDYKSSADICNIVEKIQQISDKQQIKFVLSLSCEKEELPECVTKLL